MSTRYVDIHLVPRAVEQFVDNVVAVIVYSFGCLLLFLFFLFSLSEFLWLCVCWSHVYGVYCVVVREFNLRLRNPFANKQVANGWS